MVSNCKKMFVWLFFIWCCSLYAMEETKKQKLGCVCGHVMPRRVVKRLMLGLIDQSENSDIAFASLRRFEYADKNTAETIKSLLEKSKISQKIHNALVKKLKKDFMPELFAKDLAGKFLDPEGTLLSISHSGVLAQKAYRQGHPHIARFCYPYATAKDKDHLFEVASDIADAKMVIYCLNREARIHAKYELHKTEFTERRFLNFPLSLFTEEYTALSRAIIHENVDLVRYLLSRNANPDSPLKFEKMIRNEGGNDSIEYSYFTTPRLLAQTKGNQEILDLIAYHDAWKIYCGIKEMLCTLF